MPVAYVARWVRWLAERVSVAPGVPCPCLCRGNFTWEKGPVGCVSVTARSDLPVPLSAGRQAVWVYLCVSTDNCHSLIMFFGSCSHACHIFSHTKFFPTALSPLQYPSQYLQYLSRSVGLLTQGWLRLCLDKRGKMKPCRMLTYIYMSTCTHIHP